MASLTACDFDKPFFIFKMENFKKYLIKFLEMHGEWDVENNIIHLQFTFNGFGSFIKNSTDDGYIILDWVYNKYNIIGCHLHIMDEDNNCVNSIYIKGVEGLFELIWHIGYEIPKKIKNRALFGEHFPTYDDQYMSILWQLEKLL